MELGHITDNSQMLSDGNLIKWVTNCHPWKALQEEQAIHQEMKAREERIALLGEDRLQAVEESSDS